MTDRRLTLGCLTLLSALLFPGGATAQDFDYDLYRDVAQQCVTHLRDARSAMDEGQRDSAMQHLELANVPCESARSILSTAITSGSLSSRRVRTLSGDYVGQEAAWITLAAELGACDEARTWMQQLVELVPDIPENVQDRYISASQAVVTCVPQQTAPSAAGIPVNPAAAPVYGTFSVAGGFQPDPTTYSLVAGGTADANALSTPTGQCNGGYVSPAPTVAIHYSATSYPLRFYVDAPDADPTLVIRAPDGQWYCNDDTVGLQPVIDFPSPWSGQYLVYIGTFDQGVNPGVTLSVTELPSVYGPTDDWMGDTQIQSFIDYSGAPLFGAYSVNSGFTPDPMTYSVGAGGSAESDTLTTAAGPCSAGWIPTTPTARFYYTSGTFPLRFYIDTPASDPTLAIHGPDGAWYCNDDSVGLQPVVDFAYPMSGQYDVFVGTYNQFDNPTVSLYLTELPGSYGPTPTTADTGTPSGLQPAGVDQAGPIAGQDPGQAIAGTTGQIGTAGQQPATPGEVGGQVGSLGSSIDVMGVPAHGTYTVTSGFTPDPMSYQVTAGGGADSSTLFTPSGMACNAGWVSNTPTLRLHYTAGTYPLRLYVNTPSADTTIAVNAPDGTWYCNDDTIGLQPVIDLQRPISGQYDVFVGTYAQAQYPQVTLFVTELPASYGPSY